LHYDLDATLRYRSEFIAYRGKFPRRIKGKTIGDGIEANALDNLRCSFVLETNDEEEGFVEFVGRPCD